MRYQKWGKNKCKIVCYSRDKSKPHLVKNENCDNPPIDAYIIEDTIIEDLFTFSLKPDKNNNYQSPLNLIDLLKEKHAENLCKLKRLYRLYAKSENETLLETIEELQTEAKKTEKELNEALKNEKDKSTEKAIKNKLKTLKDTWKYMTNQERRTIIQSVTEKIIINGDDVQIYYRF